MHCQYRQTKTRYKYINRSQGSTLSIFTARKRSLGQGNIFTPVCHSVHRVGGVPDQVHPPGADTPPDQVHPPGADIPQSRHPPGPGTPPRTRYIPPGADPPGPGTLPELTPRTRYTPWDQVHPPRPGTPTPPGADTPPGPGTPPEQTHTPGTRYTPPPRADSPQSRACWEIRSTRGRSASYWNAIQ